MTIIEDIDDQRRSLTIIDDIDDRRHWRSTTIIDDIDDIDDIDERQQSTTTMTIFWSDGTEKWLERRGSDRKFVELYDDNEDNIFANNNYDNHNVDNNEND